MGGLTGNVVRRAIFGEVISAFGESEDVIPHMVNLVIA